MSEDTGPSDHTPLSQTEKRFADETFIVREAVSMFGATARSEELGVVLGPGDDAAVLDCGGAEFVVVSCDSAVEGVHFKREWLSLRGFDAADVGAGAVFCAASDIAAMGAIPKTVLVSAGIPARTSAAEAGGLLRGVAEGCESLGAAVVGGNTTSSPVIFVDVKVIGATRGRRFVRRRGARPGDAVFVTGELGGAAAEIRMLDAPEGGGAATVRRPPRISVGAALCGGAATAMTDVSDGLVMDLGNIAAASVVGADVFAEKVPVSGGADLRDALVSGGDYELVFTAPPERAGEVGSISERTGVRITRIGTVTDGGAVRVFGPAGEIPASELGAGGFVHNGPA